MKNIKRYVLGALMVYLSFCTVFAEEEDEFYETWVDQAGNLLEVFNSMAPEMDNVIVFDDGCDEPEDVCQNSEGE